MKKPLLLLNLLTLPAQATYFRLCPEVLTSPPPIRIYGEVHGGENATPLMKEARDGQTHLLFESLVSMDQLGEKLPDSIRDHIHPLEDPVPYTLSLLGTLGYQTFLSGRLAELKADHALDEFLAKRREFFRAFYQAPLMEIDFQRASESLSGKFIGFKTRAALDFILKTRQLSQAEARAALLKAEEEPKHIWMDVKAYLRATNIFTQALADEILENEWASNPPANLKALVANANDPGRGGGHDRFFKAVVLEWRNQRMLVYIGQAYCRWALPDQKPLSLLVGFDHLEALKNGLAPDAQALGFSIESYDLRPDKIN